RAAIALDLVQAAQEHASLAEAAMAVVNELATVVKADRVSLGIEHKGKLALRAISRTAWFDPKSQRVEAIEGAMEEAIDQAGWGAGGPPSTGSGTEACVRAGSALSKGEALATRDDRDLKREKARREAEKEQATRKYLEAFAKHDLVTPRVLAAQLPQVEAHL